MKRENINKIFYAIYSPLVWLLLKIKGVKSALPSYWIGFPFISKAPKTSIVIGEGCRFASRKTSNLIGINHRCLLSTTNGSDGIFIGKHCGFSGVSIRCFKKITIGDNVRVGANVTIIDGDAHQDDPRAGKNKDIVIEDNVWLGMNVVVLKGVTIGRNSLIGAGSIVTKDIPANVVAAGNPCRIVKQLDESVIKKLEA
jgi:acetyltransferase-like isoleucine patch superfamily enzyme